MDGSATDHRPDITLQLESSLSNIYTDSALTTGMNLVSLATGFVLITIAMYTASDPLSRARTWVDVGNVKHGPEWAKNKQRWRAWFFAFVIGGLGLFFVVTGLAL